MRPYANGNEPKKTHIVETEYSLSKMDVIYWRKAASIIWYNKKLEKTIVKRESIGGRNGTIALVGKEDVTHSPLG